MASIGALDGIISKPMPKARAARNTAMGTHLGAVDFPFFMLSPFRNGLRVRRQQQNKPTGGHPRFGKCRRTQWHLRNAVGQTIDDRGRRQFGPPRGLGPRISSKTGQDRKDREWRAVRLGPDLGEQKFIQARIFQGERICVRHLSITIGGRISGSGNGWRTMNRLPPGPIAGYWIPMLMPGRTMPTAGP